MTDVNELRARIHALDAERGRLYHERVELQQQLADATGAQRARTAEGVRALGLSDELLAEIRDHVSRMERSGHGSPWPRYVSLLLTEVDRLRGSLAIRDALVDEVKTQRDEALAQVKTLREALDRVVDAGVEQWHRSVGPQPLLHEWLGLTLEEYKAWFAGGSAALAASPVRATPDCAECGQPWSDHERPYEGVCPHESGK